MSGDAGGWLWLVIDVILVGIFALVLIYGLSVWRKKRSPAANRARDEATKELYRKDSNGERSK